MFINVDDRLRHALSKELEPGERVVASAFGLYTVSRVAARWILILGLLLPGLLLLGILNDKVFVILTNRRLLIIRLTTKGLYRCGRTSLDVSGMTGVRREKRILFHDLEFNCHGKDYRFKFSEQVIGFRNAGERAVQLSDALTGLTDRFSDPTFDPDFNVERTDHALADVANQNQPQRLPFLGPLLKGTLLAIPGGFFAMCCVLLIAAICIPDTGSASDATLLVVGLLAFVAPFLCAVALVVWIVRRARARARAEWIERSELAEDRFEWIQSEAQPAV